VSEIDWDHRELCPDGACNGVVGADGVCKVCGKAVPNWGDERMRGLSNDPDEEASDEDDDEYEDDDEDAEYEDDDAEEGDEQPADWNERKLCDDGACVGVIGANGTCTVCGKKSAA
jgi:hypothetical protein